MTTGGAGVHLFIPNSLISLAVAGTRAYPRGTNTPQGTHPHRDTLSPTPYGANLELPFNL